MSRFKDVLEYDARGVNYGQRSSIMELCYNSWSQDVNYNAKIEASCYTIKNLEWSDAVVDKNDVLQCVYSINPTFFDFIDPTVIFCELEHALMNTPPN